MSILGISPLPPAEEPDPAVRSAVGSRPEPQHARRDPQHAARDPRPARDWEPAGGYQLTLQITADLARVEVSGAVDSSGADAIGSIISSDGPVSTAIEIDAVGVRAVHPDTVTLLVAAARERRQHGLPGVVVVAASPAVLKALTRSGLTGPLPCSLG